MAVNIRPGVDLATDHGPDIIRYTAVFAVFATVAVIGRIVSRRIQKAKWNASDFMIGLGLVGCWAETATVMASTSYGFGKHIEMVPLDNRPKILQTTFASEIIYSITLPIIKVSILLLYRSLFPGRGFAILTNLVALFVISWGIEILLVSIFSCHPVHGFWDNTIPNVCIDTRNFFIANSVPSISADIFILALPVRKVWQLQMSLRSKVIVSGLFLLGGFACVISGVRFYFLLQLDEIDVSWNYGVAVWSVMEVNVALISACLPTMRPLLTAVKHKFTSLGSSASGSGSFSWAVGLFKGRSSSQTSSKPSQQGRDDFHRLTEYPLGHMPAPKPAEINDLENAIDEPKLENLPSP